MFRIRVANLAEVERFFGLIDRSLFKEVLEPALASMAAFAEMQATNRVPVSGTPPATLKQSIHYNEPRNHGTWADVELIADAPYAVYVEMGFRPHFVPFHLSAELQDWVRRHLHYVPASAPPGMRHRGRVYMRDSEGNLRWGLPVSGRAQPFMRPAAIATGEVAPELMAIQMRKHLAQAGGAT
jgi:hypothetical protein